MIPAYSFTLKSYCCKRIRCLFQHRWYFKKRNNNTFRSASILIFKILGNGRMIFLGGLNIFRRASRVKRCKISSTGNWVGNIKLKPDYHNFPHKDNDQILKDFQHILDRQKLCIFNGYISNSGTYLTVTLYIDFINLRWVIQRTRLWTRLLFWHCRCCGSHNSLRGFHHPIHLITSITLLIVHQLLTNNVLTVLDNLYKQKCYF